MIWLPFDTNLDSGEFAKMAGLSIRASFEPVTETDIVAVDVNRYQPYVWVLSEGDDSQSDKKVVLKRKLVESRQTDSLLKRIVTPEDFLGVHVVGENSEGKLQVYRPEIWIRVSAITRAVFYPSQYEALDGREGYFVWVEDLLIGAVRKRALDGRIPALLEGNDDD